MPAVTSSLVVEKGVSIFTYEGRDGFYLRRWNKASRSYQVKKIKGATTQTQALLLLADTVAELSPTPSRRKVVDAGASFAELIEDFHKHEDQRVAAGFKDDHSAMRRRQCLKVVLRYLTLNGIEYPSQLVATSFEDYPVFRVQDGIMKGTIKKELADASVFFRSYLRPRGYVSVELIADLFPKVKLKDEDRDANPSISPKDYDTINRYIRGEWLSKAPTHGNYYVRNLFWTLTHLLKNSGCRPGEMLALRRKDVEITNPMRWSESQGKMVDDYKLTIHIKKSKTGSRRYVLCRSNAANRLIDFLKFQTEYFNKHSSLRPDEDSLIFCKPSEGLDKGYSYSYFNQMWRRILRYLSEELEGNKFSDRNVTLYSLRSTWIEDCISEGMDVYLTARLAGNSVTILQKYYDKSDVLRRANEVQSINRGQKKQAKPQVIDVAGL